MTPGGAASFIVVDCVFATVLCLIAGVAKRGGERRLWLGIAFAIALFGIDKAFGVQAMIVARGEAWARAGGWYADRRGPQGMVVGVCALIALLTAAALVIASRRASVAARVALVATTLIVLYALLGLISLHAWDALVTRPISGIPAYALFELIGPAFVGTCAVAALAIGAPGDSVGAGRQVVIGAFLLGWMVLPVAAFPAVSDELAMLGTALPAATLVTKAALSPILLLAISLFACRADWRQWRPHWLDGVVASFCVVPLLHGRTLDALYLGAAWLAVWLLGRILIVGKDGRRDALALVAVAGLALLPIALLEGVSAAWLYGVVYGPHPFQTTGVERYVGYRPVGFFEDGNQYGIWTAMAALAGIELARTNRPWRWIAVILVAIAVASQSAGAIALLAVGAFVLLVRPTLPRWLIPASGALLLVGGATYVSGVVPLEHIARDTRPGQMVLGAFRAIGRNSFTWRISQDQRALPLIARHPAIGYGSWDWWKPLGRRPWGLPMLVIGQYGLLGLGLLLVAMLGGALATLGRGVRDERYALAVIVLLAAIDAFLNSTIYFPAILFAAALAGMASTGRKAWT